MQTDGRWTGGPSQAAANRSRIGIVYARSAGGQLAVFAGRLSQIQDVVSAAAQRGYHLALYGERGVGKTSLANVLAEVFGSAGLSYRVAIVNCSTGRFV